MKHRLFWALSLLLALSLAPFALAGVYQGTTYGYVLNIPDDWRQIPDQALQGTMKVVMKAGAQSPVVWDTGFQPTSTKGWFQYPYILVQICPYDRMGLNRQVNEDEFPDVVKAISGVDVKRDAGKVLNDNIKDMVSDANFGQPLLDSANRRFTIATSMKVQGIGQVKGLTVGHFGKESMIQVCYYDKATNWDQSIGAAKRVMDLWTPFRSIRPTSTASNTPTPTRRTTEPPAS